MSRDKNLFPSNSPQRIQLPLPEKIAPALGQVPSWRVIFSREKVNVLAEPLSQGADDEGYYPINAAFLDAPGCRPSGCEDATVFIDDAISRCTIYLNEATILSNGIQPISQILDYKIRASAAAVGSAVFHGSLVIPTNKTDINNTRSPLRALIVTISGHLFTQVEFWARVPDGPTAMPLDIRLQFVMDRLGSQAFAQPGNLDLPLPCCTGMTGPFGPTSI